jgi:hypothetical protein
VLFRLAYLGVTHTLALIRLLLMSNRDKDAEILALRHQITVLERHQHGEKIRFTPAARVLLAALLHRLPRDALRSVRLLVRPEAVLRWHRDLIAYRHAVLSRPKLAGRRPTIRSIRLLVLRLAREMLIVVILGLVPTLNRATVPPPGGDGAGGTGDRHGDGGRGLVKAVQCRSPPPLIG